MGKKSFKAALLQLDLDFLQLDENLAKASQNIREAAAHGAKIICLPEAFNTGYLGTDIASMAKLAEYEAGESLGLMQRLACELKVYLIVPIILKTDAGIENAAFLINDQGAIIGHYAKTHLVGDESKYFQRGTKYPVWDTPLGKIGILLCYDVCFPETSRLLALKGAEIIFVPAAWRGTSYYKRWWDLNVQCRALDNLVYMAACNRTGSSGEEAFAGKSQFVSPIGAVIDSCGVNEEGILYGELAPATVYDERKLNTVWEDRHTEDYELLSKPLQPEERGGENG